MKMLTTILQIVFLIWKWEKAEEGGLLRYDGGILYACHIVPMDQSCLHRIPDCSWALTAVDTQPLQHSTARQSVAFFFPIQHTVALNCSHSSVVHVTVSALAWINSQSLQVWNSKSDSELERQERQKLIKKPWGPSQQPGSRSGFVETHVFE